MTEASLRTTAEGTQSAAALRLRFAAFTLDLVRAELQRDGVAVPLRPKAFALLALLARNPGRLLTKAELVDAIWPGVVVTDDSLTQCIHDLRMALGDEGSRIVRTVARRGYRFDATVHIDEDLPVAARAPAQRAARTRVIAAIGAALAAALAVAIGLFAWLRPATEPNPAPALSIVVLPLSMEAGSTEADWFGDALTRDLTTELGQVSGAFVISSDTARVYKGKQIDPRQVARELGVRYVVKGAAWRDRDRVRLSLSMVEGASGAQHWTQRFAIERARLGETVDEVAKQVARSLSVQMLRSGGERAAALHPDLVQADDLAMQGWSVYFRGVSRENLLAANQLFEESVARDARCIRGWGGVAISNGLLAGNFWAPDREAAIARLQQARQRLHELDQNDVYTYFANYFVALLKSDYDSLLEISTAMTERFPSHPQPHFGRALALMNLGRFEECVEPTLRAIRIGPRDPGLGLWHRQIGTCYFFRGDYPRAVEHARLAYQWNPNLPTAPLLLAASLAKTGQMDEARELVADLMNRKSDVRAADVEKILRVNRNERYLEGRKRWIDTLRELGMP